MNSISEDKQRLYERVKKDESLHPRFFSKIKGLVWFDILTADRLLLPSCNPKPIQSGDKQWRVPFWNVTAYLVSSSQKLKLPENELHVSKYLKLVRDITEYAKNEQYSNHSTWRQLILILKNIPIKFIDLDKDVDMIDYWLDDKFDNYAIVSNVKDWIVDLLNEGKESDTALAEKLLFVLFKVKEIDDKYHPDKKIAAFRISNYMVSDIATSIGGLLVKKIGFPFIQFIENIFKQILNINDNDQSSIFWRSAIEDHSQNRNADEIQNIVLVLFRDSLLHFYFGDQRYLLSLLDSPFIIIQRLAIFLFGKLNLITDECFNKVITKEHFTDQYRHEVYYVLQENFETMTKDQKHSVLNLILKIPMVDHHEYKKERLAYKRAEWYSAIKGSEEGKKLYEDCLLIIDSPPEHPDFSMYMSCGTIVEKSPISLSDLQIMLDSPNEMIRFLNDYKVEVNFRGPNIEGLIKTFGQLVSLQFDQIIASLDALSKLKPYFINELFSSFEIHFQKDPTCYTDFIWTKILTFSDKVFKNKAFWALGDESVNGVFIGTPSWVVSSFSSFFDKALQGEKSNLNLVHLQRIREILELIFTHQEGAEFSIDCDAVSVSINSPWGRCFETYIKLMVVHKKLNDESGCDNLFWNIYETFLDLKLNEADLKYEFITLIALNYGNFRYLSRSWVDNNANKLFNEETLLHWQCAIQGYSYQPYLTKELYQVYKASNYFNRIFESDNLNKETKNRNVEFIIVAYFHKFSSEKDIAELIKIERKEELRHLIWFLWSQKGNNNVDILGFVNFIWPKLFLLQDDKSAEFKELIFRLCYWIDFIDRIDETNKKYLIKLSSYISGNYRLNTFIEQLARLSKDQPSEIYDVMNKMKWNRITGYISNNDFYRVLFKNLINWDVKGKCLIKDISGKLAQKGDERFAILYTELASNNESD